MTFKVNLLEVRSFSFILPLECSYFLLCISAVTLYLSCHFFFYIVNYSLTTYQLQCAMHRVFALACIIIQKNWIPWKANKVRKVKSLSLLYTIIKKKKKLEQILAFTMETKHVAYSNLSPFNIPNQMTAGRIWMKIILFSVYQLRLVLIQYK